MQEAILCKLVLNARERECGYRSYKQVTKLYKCSLYIIYSKNMTMLSMFLF